jgi:flagellar hook-associated protein 3 FlgL
MVQRNILADLNRVNERLSRTENKLSSGKDITRPSDDPAAASKALTLREGLKANQQQQRNVNDGTAWADATETALSTMTDVVQRARELVVQGASESTDPASRTSIAKEIDQLAQSLKEQANTQFAGRFLFSGTATKTAPYADGSDTYAGNTDAIAREIGPGVSVNVNTTADTILGSGQGAGDGKLLNTLLNIRDHLNSGDTASLQGVDLKGLDTGLDTLMTARAANGALTDRLEAAATRLSSMEELSTKQLSDTEDADMAKTLVDYSTQQSAYQAALKAGAQLVQLSLLDFLT